MEKDKKKSFKCEICDSHFKQNQSLESHISSVHEDQELFRCEICGKSLSGHIAAVHEGKKPFKCNICDYSCSRKGNMKQHVEFFHEGKKQLNVRSVITAVHKRVT